MYLIYIQIYICIHLYISDKWLYCNNIYNVNIESIKNSIAQYYIHYNIYMYYIKMYILITNYNYIIIIYYIDSLIMTLKKKKK